MALPRTISLANLLRKLHREAWLLVVEASHTHPQSDDYPKMLGRIEEVRALIVHFGGRP